MIAFDLSTEPCRDPLTTHSTFVARTPERINSEPRGALMATPDDMLVNVLYRMWVVRDDVGERALVCGLCGIIPKVTSWLDALIIYQ